MRNARRLRPRASRQPRLLTALAVLRAPQTLAADPGADAVAVQGQAVPAQATRAFHDAPPASSRARLGRKRDVGRCGKWLREPIVGATCHLLYPRECGLSGVPPCRPVPAHHLHPTRRGGRAVMRRLAKPWPAARLREFDSLSLRHLRRVPLCRTATGLENQGNGNVRGSTPPPSAILDDIPVTPWHRAKHEIVIAHIRRPSRGGSSAVRAAGLYPVGRWCNSIPPHHIPLQTITQAMPGRSFVISLSVILTKGGTPITPNIRPLLTAVTRPVDHRHCGQMVIRSISSSEGLSSRRS